jgi:hypothetical protein
MKNDDRYPEGTNCPVCYRAGLPQPIFNEETWCEESAAHLMTHMPTPEEHEAINILWGMGYPEPNSTTELQANIDKSLGA